MAVARVIIKNREQHRVIFDNDGDGWDDLWVITEIKSRKLEGLRIMERPNDDDDGDGFTNREEMFLYSSPLRRALVPTPQELARQIEAARVYAEQSNREHLAKILPQIEEGLRSVQAAVPAVISEEEANPEAKKQRLLDAAASLLTQEEDRKKRTVKGFSKEAAQALGDPAAGLILGGASNGRLELMGPDNLVSAQTMSTSAVWPGGASTAPDLTGFGQQIGIWEAGGGVLARHSEFLLSDGSSRVAQVDDTAAEIDSGVLGTANLGIFNFHATQVAGVLASAGNLGTAKGMAFQANVAAYGSAGDIAEMMAAAASGMKVSNHSYSARFGWIYLSGAWYWLGGTAAGGSPNLYPGPDYFYGWGLMNTRRAAETLDQNQRTISHRTHLREHTLFNGNTVEVLVEVGSNTPRLQPTLSWTDPAYQSANSASGVDENLPAVAVDSTISMLINDLDLKVVRPEGGAAIEAWRLNPSNPRAAATRGDNTVDNVEQVTVLPLSGSYLTPGTYKLQITHKGSLRRAQQTSSSPLRYQLLTGEYQKFSLAITGNIERTSDLLRATTVDRAVTPSNMLVPLTWTSDKGLRYRVQRSLDLLTWTDVPGDITATGSSSTTTMTEALGINRLFYRVKEVNP